MVTLKLRKSQGGDGDSLHFVWNALGDYLKLARIMIQMMEIATAVMMKAMPRVVNHAASFQLMSGAASDMLVCSPGPAANILEERATRVKNGLARKISCKYVYAR